ncbi:BamA/TamA family outer membrane protein [bacterium]|nr:BamA/TamA family outer membrane protein [bacterium]
MIDRHQHMPGMVCIAVAACMILHAAPAVSGAASKGEPVLENVRFEGVKALSRGQAEEILDLVPGKPLPEGWPDASFFRLGQAYGSEGFWEFQVDSLIEAWSPDSQRISIVLRIREGRPFLTGRFSCSGMDSALMRSVPRRLHSGRRFRARDLESDIGEMLSVLEDSGFPLSEIRLDSLTVRETDVSVWVDVRLSVSQGDSVRLTRISATGNTLTRSSVILRETRLRMKELFRISRIEEAVDRLKRTGFFAAVHEPVISFTGQGADVVFPIQEGNSSSFDGVLGYTPPTRNMQRGYFTGRIQFSFKNLFGTGRFLDAYWEKKDRLSEAMRFGYEEPWIFKKPLHPGVRFQQEMRDTTYVEREWRLTVRYNPWNVFSLGLHTGQRTVLPDSLGSILYGLEQTHTHFVSVWLDYSTFNDLWNPRKGVRYYTEVRAGRRRDQNPDSLQVAGESVPVDTRMIQIDAEMAWNPAGWQVLYLGLHGREVKTDEPLVPVSEQIRFGGSRTVRGYEEDFFRADLAAWINLEYRYLIGKKSRVFLFLDSAFFQRRQKVEGLFRGVKTGYGFGLRLETRLGLLGIDYGLGDGDGFMQGKVHVGLVNEF